MILSALVIGIFPIALRNGTLITLLTVGIPSIALALWARPGVRPRTSLARDLLHSSKDRGEHEVVVNAMLEALNKAARRCFPAALAALPRIGLGDAVVDACREFADRYVDRGRCPADDVLDAWS